MQTIKCRCCGTGMKALDTYKEYTRLGCETCGFQHFFKDGTRIEAANYEEDADYQADLAVAADHKDLLQWSHRKVIEYFEANLRKVDAKLLDVGCFNGFFVRELRERGFDAIGIDFNKKAIAYGAETYGLGGGAISTQTLADLKAQNLRFDAITLFEVIEHLSDFDAVIEEAKELLNPSGLLIFSTPNSRMCWRPILDFPPHHLSRFSPHALEALVRSHGMDKVALIEQMSLYDLLRNYLGSLARNKQHASMRGGEFRVPRFSNALRRGANKIKVVGNFVLAPANWLLHAAGVRYISQVIIAKS